MLGAAIRPDRVAMYIRWSTEDQREGTTLQVQREGCEHYILSQGWQLNPALLFVDDGYSGGSLQRPAMARLRQAVQSGEVDCVVVFKLDRLSRSVLDTVRLVLEEWDGCCCLRSAREAVDTASPSGKMLFYMLVSYAEWERGTIRERTLAGKVKRAEAGRNPGFTPPFGYRLAAGGGFTTVEREAETVRLAFRCCLAGLAAPGIAQRLNATGVLPRSGVAWTAGGVRRLLGNPAYAGELHYGRRPRTSGGRRRTLGPAAIVCPGALPPLVAPGEWRATQERLRWRQGRAGEHALAGLAQCPCGAALRVRLRRGEAVYACGGRGRAPGTAHAPAVSATALDGAVLAALWHRFGPALAATGAGVNSAQAWQRLDPQERRAVLRGLAARIVAAPEPTGCALAVIWYDGPQRRQAPGG